MRIDHHETCRARCPGSARDCLTVDRLRWQRNRPSTCSFAAAARRRHRCAGARRRCRRSPAAESRPLVRCAMRPRRTTIDARGLVVAPGFIDVHTHADEIAEHPLAEHFVAHGSDDSRRRQLRRIGGRRRRGFRDDREDGHLDQLRDTRRPQHGPARGHGHRATRADGGRAREDAGARHQGDGGRRRRLLDRPAVRARHLRRHSPRSWRSPRVAAKQAGSTPRTCATRAPSSRAPVEEALAIGEAAQCPVEISHLKVDAPSRWGASAKALAMIDAARAKGLQVDADVYLYDAASSSLGIRFPSWVLEGGQDDINERLDDAADVGAHQGGDEEADSRARARELHLRPNRVVPSRSVAERSVDPGSGAHGCSAADDLEAQLEIMRRMLRAGGASMVYQFMAEDDIEPILRHPQVSIASDSGLNVIGEGVPHPRGYGNNARALGALRARAQDDRAGGGGSQDDVASGGALRLSRSRTARRRPGRRCRHLRSGARRRSGHLRAAAPVSRTASLRCSSMASWSCKAASTRRRGRDRSSSTK